MFLASFYGGLMDPKALPFSESVLRLSLGIAAVILAAWMSQHSPAKAALHVSLPKPGLVMEW